MFTLNIPWFRKKNIAGPDLNPYSGFIMEDNSKHDENDSAYHCLAKGLIIFTATMGSIHGVLSEFDISYNFLVVALFIFLASMALSFMHIKKWIFNLGYPLLFVVFTSALVQFRTLANSGFQALTNIINEAYSSHFLLNFTRESTELISDRYITITTTAVFVGIFLAILINVGIFNDMYFLTVFDFTFWPLQLGIYIGKYPSYLSMVFVFFAFFAACFLKISGHYHFVYPQKKKKMQYHFAYSEKGTDFIFHKSNARNMLHICAFAMVVAIFFSAFGIMSVKTSETEAVKSGSLKSKMDEPVKIFVQNGFMGLFNRYDSTGGVSGGKLGGVRSVRPDYEPDLRVTFVPYAYERMYLKSFVGCSYTSTEWKTPADSDYMYAALDSSKAAFAESKALSGMMDVGMAPYMHGKMMIENLDAGTNYLYLPYYTDELPARGFVTDESTINGVSAIGSTSVVDYIPYSASRADIKEIEEDDFMSLKGDDDRQLTRAYKTEAYNNYLTIPDSIKEELESYHEIIGDGADVSEQILLIRNFFYSGYEYDMSPGATPYGKDYATYFLGTQRRGFCVHFATAGTLLLRSYGIPARYVEGYVIDQKDISESGQLADYSYDEFFQGKNPLETAQVTEVEISDGNAHAWCEAYIDGFGWIPVEMTPPSDDEEEVSYSDFLSALSGLLNAGAAQAENTNNGFELPQGNEFLRSLRFESSPVLYTFFAVIALLLLLPLIIKTYQAAVLKRARANDYASGNYISSIGFAYGRLKQSIKKRHPQANVTLPEDIALLVSSYLDNPDYASDKHVMKLVQFLNQHNTTIDELVALTQKGVYSQSGLSKEDADLLIAFYESATRIFHK